MDFLDWFYNTTVAEPTLKLAEYLKWLFQPTSSYPAPDPDADPISVSWAMIAKQFDASFQLMLLLWPVSLAVVLFVIFELYKTLRGILVADAKRNNRPFATVSSTITYNASKPRYNFGSTSRQSSGVLRVQRQQVLARMDQAEDTHFYRRTPRIQASKALRMRAR